MRRRNVGVAAIKRKREAAEKFETKGTELHESSLEAMSSQMETFRQNLEEFARNHKQDIKKDPAFRKHFQVGISRFTDGKRYNSRGVLTISPAPVIPVKYLSTCFNMVFLLKIGNVRFHRS